MKLNTKTHLLPFLLLIFIAINCSTSESTMNSNEQENIPSNTDSLSASNTPSNESLLLVSELSDTYSSNNNDIPGVYSEIKKEKEVEIDLTKGFRIQIYSGQNILEADSLASNFRAWSDTTISGYQAETYTFFKTPYYRVHVGDFHDRAKALSYSKIVKRLFRDAWVVYDTVDPFLVPNDTTAIKFQDL